MNKKLIITGLISLATVPFLSFISPKIVNSQNTSSSNTTYCRTASNLLSITAYDLGYRKTQNRNYPTCVFIDAGETYTINYDNTNRSPRYLMGQCDMDCIDVDFYLYHNDELVDLDILEDDYPIVEASRQGEYQLVIDLPQCNTNSCAVVIGEFSLIQ